MKLPAATTRGMYRALLALPLIALLTGLLPAWLAARETPLLDVHSRPWVTHAGRLLERFPIGQGFYCEEPGLRRIDVALVGIRRPARGGVILRLHTDHAGGEVLREVEVLPPERPEPGGFVRFDFEPIADSAGRWFQFQVLPSKDARPGDHSVWVRYHGQVGHNSTWGYQRYEETLIEGRLRVALPAGVEPDPDDQTQPDEVPHAWLRAVSFATLGIAPRLGPARLELWEEGRQDGPPVRVAELAEEDEVLTGHVFFAFEPIAESRFEPYRYRLTLPPGTVLLGDRWGPSLKTWHGLDGGDARLSGVTLGDAARPDRDLVFRAWARSDPGAALARAAERAGWRLWVGLGAWLGASLLVLCLALGSIPSKSPPPGFHRT